MSEFEESSEEAPPKSPIAQHLTKIIAGVLVLVVGFFAYTFMAGDSAPVVTEVTAPVNQNSNANLEAKQKQVAEENERKRLENEAKARLEKEAQEKRLLAQAEAQRVDAENRALALKREQEEREQAQRNLEQQQADRKAAVEEARRQAAVRKLTRLKSLLEADLEKFKNELIRVDGEIAKNIPFTENVESRIEKARLGIVAAKNQKAYTEKKIEEASLQMREFQKTPTAAQQQIANLNKKLEGLRIDLQRFDDSITRANEEQMIVSNQATRAQQNINDFALRRKNLIRVIKEKVVELNQLCKDPDFVELAKLGAEADVKKALAQAEAMIATIPPHEMTSVQKNASPPPPVAVQPDKPSDSSVTVTTQKTKVTVYTLKDGKTVSATKAVDAGEMLSVKTLDGKFQSIFKEDIVKEETKEQ